MEHCKQCGAEIQDREIEKMKANESPYEFAISDWMGENPEWYCGDCARSFDQDVPEDWEVYYLG